MRVIAAGAIVVACSAVLLAASFERPRTFAISAIPGLKAADDNYTIAEPVRSDGLLRIYSLTTPYGDFSVHGDQMMRMRLVELAVLRELEKISGSETFSKSLVAAGLSPLKYTGRFIVNPGQTINETFTGIGSMFGRIGSSMNNPGNKQDDFMQSLLGVSDQKRKLAAKFGVDPYTDFPPLAAKLDRLSEAATAGGLTVSGALMFVPGAIGIVVSNLSTANTLGDMKIEDIARDLTAVQILDRNRQRLAAMGAESALIETLLSNRNYTPIDMAVMVAAIDSMNTVADRPAFFARAAAVESRSIAYFMRRRAEMLAVHQARTRTLVRFVDLGGYPFNVARDGKVVGVMPADAVSWTDDTARALGAATADMRRTLPGAHGELRISGQATSLAKREIKALGWQVVENVKF